MSCSARGANLFTIAHEAAHIVQQRSGIQLRRGVGEPGDVYERHADEVASLVVQGQSAEAVLDVHARRGTSSTAEGPGVVVQCILRDEYGTYTGIADIEKTLQASKRIEALVKRATEILEIEVIHMNKIANDVGARWYFQMYGPANKSLDDNLDQSFHSSSADYDGV